LWTDSGTIVIPFLFLTALRWRHKWPKHGGGYYVINLIHNHKCIFWSP